MLKLTLFILLILQGMQVVYVTVHKCRSCSIVCCPPCTYRSCKYEQLQGDRKNWDVY